MVAQSIIEIFKYKAKLIHHIDLKVLDKHFKIQFYYKLKEMRIKNKFLKIFTKIIRRLF